MKEFKKYIKVNIGRIEGFGYYWWVWWYFMNINNNDLLVNDN
jgi:hypothetical protein